MRREDYKESAPGRVIKTTMGYEAFVPYALPPVLPPPTWKLIGCLSEADRAISRLAGVAQNLPNPHLLINPFLRREAVASSRIEGTEASLSDLLYFEASDSAQASRADVEEIANYVEAIEYGLSFVEEGRSISLTLLKEMHKILMQGVRGKDKSPGAFRDKQNGIAERRTRNLENARYVPPPPAQMRDALESLEQYIQETSDLPFLLRLALVHYQFEAIHPFEDGNGRIGRLLITLLLCAEMILPAPLLYLSSYLERRRDEYIDMLLAVSTDGAWEQWITFFLAGVTEQSLDGVRRATQLITLREEYRERLQRGFTTIALRLVDEMFAVPVVTIRKAAVQLGVTTRAIQQNVDRLVAEDILKEATGRARNRVFVAPAILAIIEAQDAPTSTA